MVHLGPLQREIGMKNQACWKFSRTHDLKFCYNFGAKLSIKMRLKNIHKTLNFFFMTVFLFKSVKAIMHRFNCRHCAYCIHYTSGECHA